MTKQATINNAKQREKYVARERARVCADVLFTYLNDLNKNTDTTLVDISDNLCDQVLRDLSSSNKNTLSADKLQWQIEMNEQGTKKKKSVTKLEENPNGTVITPEKGGIMLLVVLLNDKGHAGHVHTELQQRGIEPPIPIKDTEWKEAIDLLRVDKNQLLVQQEPVQSIENWKDIKEMMPQLDLIDSSDFKGAIPWRSSQGKLNCN